MDDTDPAAYLRGGPYADKDTEMDYPRRPTVTTPPVCTRTDPHPPHPYWETNVLGIGACPGVLTPSYGEEQAAHARAAASCTRTWRTAGDCPANDAGKHHCAAAEHYHHVRHACECGNAFVEPDEDGEPDVGPGPGDLPADVQATPDPRPDVVAQVLFENLHVTVGSGDFVARRILDALDDLAGAQTMHEPDPGQDAAIYREGWQAGYRSGTRDREDLAPTLGGTDSARTYEPAAVPCTTAEQQIACPWRWAYNEHIGVPVGLSAAQEIRLRFALAELARRPVYEMHVHSPRLAAWVERGDETPDLNRLRDAESRVEGLTLAHAFWKERAEQAEARADLAEARLGHIQDLVLSADASEGPYVVGVPALFDALAWTPDDTATADAATEDDSGPIVITREELLDPTVAAASDARDRARDVAEGAPDGDA